MTDVQTAGQSAERYKKIGGGLILVAILLFYILIALVVSSTLFATMLFVNQSTLLSILEPTGIRLTYAILKPYLIYELARNAVFFVFIIFVLVCFFRRKKQFVRFMTAFIALDLIFMIVDYYVAHFIFKTAQGISRKDLIGYAVIAGVYALTVLYVLVSKRVKATFVR